MIYDQSYLRKLKYNPFYIEKTVAELEEMSRRENRDSIALAICIISIAAAAWLAMWLVGAQ